MAQSLDPTLPGPTPNSPPPPEGLLFTAHRIRSLGYSARQGVQVQTVPDGSPAQTFTEWYKPAPSGPRPPYSDDGFNGDADLQGENEDPGDPRDDISWSSGGAVSASSDEEFAYPVSTGGEIPTRVVGPYGAPGPMEGSYTATNGYSPPDKIESNGNGGFNYEAAAGKLASVSYFRGGNANGWQGNGPQGVKAYTVTSTFTQGTEAAPPVAYEDQTGQPMVTTATYGIQGASMEQVEVRLQTNKEVEEGEPVSMVFLLTKSTVEGQTTTSELLATLKLSINVGKVSDAVELLSGALPANDVTSLGGVVSMRSPPPEAGKAISYKLFPMEIATFKRGTLNAPGPAVPAGTGEYGYETVMMENADSENSASSTSRDCDDSESAANLNVYRRANDDDLVQVVLKWPAGLRLAGTSLKLLHNGMQVDATQTTADAAINIDGPSRLNFYKDDGTRITNPAADLQITDLANAPTGSYLSKILVDGEVTIFIEGADSFGDLPARKMTRLGGAVLKWEFTKGELSVNTKLLVYRGGFLRFLQPAGAPGTVGSFEFRDGKGRIRHSFRGFGNEFTNGETDLGNVVRAWTTKSGKTVNNPLPKLRGGPYNIEGRYGHTPPGWWRNEVRRGGLTGNQCDTFIGSGPSKLLKQGGYIRWKQDDETDPAKCYTTPYRYDASNAHDAMIGPPAPSTIIGFKYDMFPIEPTTAQNRTDIQIHPDGECGSHYGGYCWLHRNTNL